MDFVIGSEVVMQLLGRVRHDKHLGPGKLVSLSCLVQEAGQWAKLLALLETSSPEILTLKSNFNN